MIKSRTKSSADVHEVRRTKHEIRARSIFKIATVPTLWYVVEYQCGYEETTRQTTSKKYVGQDGHTLVFSWTRVGKSIF